MPKRRHDGHDEERWQRKIKKYQEKLNKNRLIIYSDEENEANQEPTTDTNGMWYVVNEEPESAPPPPAPPAPPLADAEGECTLTDEATPPPVAAPCSAEPPDAPTVETAPGLDVDPDLLDALGAFEEDKTDFGEPILDHIAMRLKPILLNGLKKEDKDILLKKFLFPKNLTLAKAPTLNAEISAMLNESSRNRDKRLLAKQNQLGIILSAFTKAMSLLMCKNPKIIEILSILSDTSKLLADSHYLETDTRRALITPLVDKELIDPFKDRTRDDFLFGENLGELVKNSRGIKKTGQLIQAHAVPNLNARGPSSRGRHPRNYSSRGGGQQRPYRRRAAPFAPHQQASAPPRRQAQAPPRRGAPPAGPPSAPRSATVTATAAAGQMTS